MYYKAFLTAVLQIFRQDVYQNGNFLDTYSWKKIDEKILWIIIAPFFKVTTHSFHYFKINFLKFVYVTVLVLVQLYAPVFSRSEKIMRHVMQCHAVLCHASNMNEAVCTGNTHPLARCMIVCTMQYMHDGHKYVNVNKKWADNQDNCFTLRGSICNETIKGIEMNIFVKASRIQSE